MLLRFIELDARNLKTPIVTPVLPPAAIAYGGLEESVEMLILPPPDLTLIRGPKLVLLATVGVIEYPDWIMAENAARPDGASRDHLKDPVVALEGISQLSTIVFTVYAVMTKGVAKINVLPPAPKGSMVLPVRGVGETPS